MSALGLLAPFENYFQLARDSGTRELLSTRYIRHEDHVLIVLPILLISPRSHACAASVFTLGCQIIKYLKPVSSQGALKTLIL
jgi:hypothetical protein